MQIAVTGATGLIGTALTAALRAEGHDVRPVVRRPSDEPGAVRWDPAAGEIDAAGLEGLDAVVHLAGAGIGDRRWTAARKQEILSSRTRGTGLLARTLAGLDRPPAVLLSGSAVGVYGDRGDEELTEASPPGEGFVADVVRAWEAAAAPAAEAGIRTVFLRSGLVLAGHGGILPRMALPFRLGVGGRLGSGKQWLSWISIDDEVAAIRFLASAQEVSGPVDLVAPGAVTNAELTAVMGRVLHRPTLVPVPAVGLRLALGREMADQLLFISQRVRPAVLTGAGFTFRHPDLETALRAVLGREEAAA
ncbi:MAG TPA: TIGR01777 family oxidoreductase [Acidimicrobiales bacterium]